MAKIGAIYRNTGTGLGGAAQVPKGCFISWSRHATSLIGGVHEVFLAAAAFY